MRHLAIATLVGLSLACSPDGDPVPANESSESGGGTAETTTEVPGSTGTPTPTPTSTSGTTGNTDTDTGPLDEGAYEEDSGGTGCTFTCPPPATTGGGGGQCSLFEQNCPEGEKCMPWANDGGMDWTAVRCSPIDDNPDQPGEPCAVEGSAWSGIDSCDLGMICLNVDPMTNEGVCGSLCIAGGDACLPTQECEIQPGELGLPLCIPTCDPVAPDCIAGEGCIPNGSSFTCQPLAKSRVPVGSPCSDPTSCEDGSLCALTAVSCGQAPGEGCCATVCDTAQPNPCGPETCVPWFGGAGSPEWDHVGYCVP